MRTCEIADEVQIGALSCGDAEGLLDESIGFVTVAVRSIGGRSEVGGRIEGSAARHDGSGGRGAGEVATTSLALHLSICQEAAGDPAGAPGLAVGPPTHAGLAFVPDEDGAGLDLLAFLFGETTLHTRQETLPAGFEEHDGVCRRSHLTDVGLHAAARGA